MAQIEPDPAASFASDSKLEPRAGHAREHAREKASSTGLAEPYLIEREAILLRRSRWQRERAATAPEAAPDGPIELAANPDTASAAARARDRYSESGESADQGAQPERDLSAFVRTYYERPSDQRAELRKASSRARRLRDWLRYIVLGR